MKTLQKVCRNSKCQLSLCLTIACLLLSPNFGTAQTVTLNNNGSQASVDLSNGGGMDNWSVTLNNQYENQLNQQWFWYSIGNGPAQAINTIGGLQYSVSGANSILTASYQNGEIGVSIQYQLNGSGYNSGGADMSESITVVNMGSTNYNLKFYQYSNFNLLGSGNNSISIDGGPGAYTGISQTTAGNGNGILEVIDSPLANFAEAGNAGMGGVLGDVASGNDLNGNLTAGPGNVAWAFEWSQAVDPGIDNAVNIFKDKNLSIQPVPEPSTIALVALGVGAFAVARRRQLS